MCQQEEQQSQHLSLNRSTGYYEGTIYTPTLVQVPKEIFDRVIFQRMKEDESADMTDPATLQRAASGVSRITNWLDKPQVKMTSLAVSATSVPAPLPPVISEPVDVLSVPSLQEQIQSQVEERARHVPPHLWDEECRTALLPTSASFDERKYVYNLRSVERRILEALDEKWKDGEFTIDPDAQRHEDSYQAELRRNTTITIEAVATASNGNRFH